MQVSNSDLTSLTVFRSVVEHRGFLGAQVALGLSQSAVSFHIKGLEQRLGFRLMQAGTKRLRTDRPRRDRLRPVEAALLGTRGI